MRPTLKPCPHCGGIAEIDALWTYRAVYDGQMRRGASIYCLSCDAQMMRCYADHPGEEREDVCAALVEAWNTRALEREAKAEQDRLAHVRDIPEGWKPIEIAPPDRQMVMLIARYPTGTDWTDIYNGWRNSDGDWTRWPHNFPPTHWMPLPSPPAPEAE